MTAPDLAAGPLLLPDEPSPLAVENPEGDSPILFVCEHGGKRFPARLGPLGLAEGDRERHFVWDVGALDLARGLAQAFGAPLLHQRYSRLVCDCNRRPDVATYIPESGEGVRVPGNQGLDEAARAGRTEAIWRPFHDGVAEILDKRCAAGRTAALITVHSFTPTFYGTPRPWTVGVLYDRDPALSPALFDALHSRFGARVGRNEPYSVSTEEDYTIPVHGEARGLPCVEIEVRNDQLRSSDGVEQWTAVLAAAIREACATAGIELAGHSARPVSQGSRE